MKLKNKHLVIVGWRVAVDERRVSMRNDVYSYIKSLSKPFGQTSLITIPYKDRDPRADKYKEIDFIDDVYINKRWVEKSDIQKPKTLIKDIHELSRIDRKEKNKELIGYIHYPGFYTFFLSPYFLTKFNTTIGYFGTEAVDRAKGAFSGGIVGKSKIVTYRSFQSFVLDRLDVAFIRDSTMKSKDKNCSMVTSRPITNFSMEDLSLPPREPPESTIQLLYVGAFRKGKGHQDLIEAFETVQNEYDCRLCLVGTGELYEEIRSLVKSKGISHSVDFTGYISDKKNLSQLYKKSDIFILPSKSEGFPRVLNEAMTAALPIITTNVGGISEELSHEENALIFDPGNIHAMRDNITRLINSPQIYKKISKKNHKKSRDFFEKDAHKQHLDVIKNL